MTNRSFRFVVLASAIALAAAACSEASPDAAAPATDAPPTETTAMAEMADDEMAHMDDDGHGDFDFGEPAEAADADRVVDIVTRDDFTFTPATVSIALGEKITFRVTNEGAIAHDFTLGRSDLQDAHDLEMAEMGGMAMADEANAFMIEPGETKELTWHFTESGDVIIGCHVAGHYAAGMRADISVEA